MMTFLGGKMSAVLVCPFFYNHAKTHREMSSRQVVAITLALLEVLLSKV